MKKLSNRQIAKILAEYSISADSRSPLVAGIQSYVGLLFQWNRSISLTAVTDPEDVVRFHFGESLFAASRVPITGGRLADVGSGAGFPGLPLKMLISSLDLTLIESNAKKAAFLAEAVRRLGLDGAHIFRGRTEELQDPAAFDLITARAFGQFDSLLAWSRTHLADSGKIVLWLGLEVVASISLKSGWNWGEPAQIPGSKRRFIVWGKPRD
ncbi:MAG: 16S rRNA (guanine(527)-N(7))-methyltransferase RsmG [Candidatus Acidiferrales bacterium]